MAAPKKTELVPELVGPYKNERSRDCGQCGVNLLVCAENYEVTPSGNYRTVCRKCRADNAANKKENKLARSRDAAINDRVKVLDSGLIKSLKAIGDEKSPNVPHASQLLEELLSHVGGVSGFAQHVWAAYLASSPSSTLRQRLLSQMITLTVKVSDMGKSEVQMDQLSDDDLDRELERRMRQQVLRMQREALPGKMVDPDVPNTPIHYEDPVDSDDEEDDDRESA